MHYSKAAIALFQFVLGAYCLPQGPVPPQDPAAPFQITNLVFRYPIASAHGHIQFYLVDGMTASEGTGCNTTLSMNIPDFRRLQSRLCDKPEYSYKAQLTQPEGGSNYQLRIDVNHAVAGKAPRMGSLIQALDENAITGKNNTFPGPLTVPVVTRLPQEEYISGPLAAAVKDVGLATTAPSPAPVPANGAAAPVQPVPSPLPA
ncbi:MAG: hypothetical protein M1833_003072 [Piccolia ochrophora]|nr:MAG: hypothetical protein M1833_003072 [Piccolia ochrophora]